MALEAFADTIVPGRKRFPDDVAIAGVSDSAGAVEAGALDVLQDPATGIEDGIGGMAGLLNMHARQYAEKIGAPVREGTEFVDLPYEARRSLITTLTGPQTATRDLWFLLALFSYMAFDSSPHRPTRVTLEDPESGLNAMGFAHPDADGRWRFIPSSYGRQLARVKPGTDERGNLP